MTSYEIDDEVARTLEEIAQTEDRSVDELVNDVLRHFAKTRADHAKISESTDERHDPDDVLLRILEGADELGERSSEGNISERSREILSTDFAIVLAELAEKYDWRSGRSDVSENFDEIIGDMMAEDFLKRHRDDDSN